MKRIALCIALLFAAGCSGNPSVAEDAGNGSDSTVQPDSNINTAWSFLSADDGADEPTVWVETESISGNQMVLLIKARRIDEMAGLAFRLGFDGATLNLASAEPTNVWMELSTSVTSRLQQKDNEVWAGIVFPGQLGPALAAVSPTTVAKLTLTLTGEQPTKVEFRALRNRVVSKQLTRVETRFLGGEFTRVPAN